MKKSGNNGGGKNLPPGTFAVRKPPGVSSHRLAVELSKKFGTVVTHTGSLDPMAEGLMVFLVGEDALKEQGRWQDADKEYEFELLFGFATDTHDSLGLITESKSYQFSKDSKSSLKKQLNQLVGPLSLPRPVYSYKVVRGKPLYWWARRGRLGEIQIPEVDVRIHEADLMGLKTVTKAGLLRRITANIRCVEGDFRQNEILVRWREGLRDHPNAVFSIAKIRMSCSKGTYVRSIAHRLGEAIGIPAIAFKIVRTRVGEIRAPDSVPVCPGDEGRGRSSRQMGADVLRGGRGENALRVRGPEYRTHLRARPPRADPGQGKKA